MVNIPSYLVQPGDVVSVREKARGQNRIQASIALSEQRTSCDWLTLDHSNFQGKFARAPGLEDISSDYNVNLVVELYSK